MLKQCPSFHNNVKIEFEKLKCLIKRFVFKDFLNTDNVPDARMFTGKLFHSRGDAVEQLTDQARSAPQHAKFLQNNL